MIMPPSPCTPPHPPPPRPPSSATCPHARAPQQADVLEEDPILQWYEKDHSQKGKNVFIKEMKPFVDWINEAEEEGPEESG